MTIAPTPPRFDPRQALADRAPEMEVAVEKGVDRELLRAAHEAVDGSLLAFVSQDYFARFPHDVDAVPQAGETAIGADWRIIHGKSDAPVVQLMATHLAQFLEERMGLALPVHEMAADAASEPAGGAIVLLDRGGGTPEEPESYTISVTDSAIIVRGRDAAGTRDGIVQLVDRIGLRTAPFLDRGDVVYRPRLPLRVGAVPWMGSLRDAVFMGYNALILTQDRDTSTKAFTSLYALSTSDALPVFRKYQDPGLLERMARHSDEARRYGLKLFCVVERWKAFAADHPVFTNHPGLRGALIYHFMGEDVPPAGYTPCTQHPLMRQYLSETVSGIVDRLRVDGVLAIVGGESFAHCYMRPANAEKGHTNCPRCEPLGAEAAVADLCNYLADAARAANPEAVLVAWPYSAGHFWSVDSTQEALIDKMKPGTAILTCVEKDEVLEKPGGVRKRIWDYSIDLIGPGERAKAQIAATKAAGIKVFLKSEPELAFEAVNLPYIPCVDRWYDRADGLASCGADGAWVFPWFQQCYGTTSTEVFKFAWWQPLPGKEAVLAALANRIAGEQAGPHLRRAWRHVSRAIELVPELPPYFAGPYYMGAAHPMCADPVAKLPAIYPKSGPFGPFVLTEARGDVPLFGEYYRRMEACLGEALAELDQAQPLVPERCQATFLAELSPARWLHSTARTHANFYESCQLRDALHSLAENGELAAAERAGAQAKFDRWRAVLTDERANAAVALALVECDPRLDFHYRQRLKLPHAADLIRAKLELTDRELDTYLPGLAGRCGLGP